MPPDSGKTCPSLAIRPKLPATADQREVRESRKLCRYHLLTGYSGLQNRIQTRNLVFSNRRLSFRRLLWAHLESLQRKVKEVSAPFSDIPARDISDAVHMSRTATKAEPAS